MGASNNFGIGGIFYSDPPGLYIDRDSGDIITASSTVGDYDVYYSRDPDFGTWSRIGADINAVVGSRGFIENNNRNGISVRLNAAGNVLITLSPHSSNNATKAGQMRAFYNNNGTWERIGHNIGGETSQTYWAENNTAHIAVNDAGDIIAMSNPENDSGCSDCGRVIVLKRKNGIWSQLGSEIHGENANVGKKYFGLSIALNSAGDVLAIGDEKDKEAGANKGIVHIYEFNGTDWVRKGATGKINPPDYGDTTPNWGWSVDLDSSGNTIVIGSRQWSSNSGRFAVYEYNAPNWNQKGDSQSGKGWAGGGGIVDDKFGYDVSINAQGNMILVGSPFHHSLNKGRADAYRYNPIDNTWKWWHTANNEIRDTDSQSRAGWSVALNASGNTAVMGETQKYDYNKKGRVTAYRQTLKIHSGVLKPKWKQIGIDIISPGATNNRAMFGWSVDLNAKGNIIAVGAPNHNVGGGGNDEGKVRVYELNMDNTREP